MSTQRDQLTNDSLGRAIRETLQMYVRDQLPSERVWQQIRAGLGANSNTSGKLHRRRPFWIPPLLQIAAVLILCIVQDADLHTPAAIRPATMEETVTPASNVVPVAPREGSAARQDAVGLDLVALKAHSPPAVPVAGGTQAHEPLLTANLGTLSLDADGARRGAVRRSTTAQMVLESRIRR